MNVKQAVTRYIALKEPVLSPSTTTAYRSIARTHLEAIADISIQAIDNKTLQRWIGDLSQTHTPKTVRNIYGLVVSSIIQFSPGAVFSVRLPAKEKPELYIPTDADIQKLLQHIKGKEIEIAVYLAAFGPMRRGEICAITSEDVKGNFVTVNKSMVHNPDKTWSIKQPKTYAGFREIEYPQFVIDRIQGIEGRLVKGTPDQISNRFNRALRFAGLPHFRFHDLRHYAASIMHAIGVPDVYIMSRGGWSSDRVLKEIYRGELDDQKRQFTNLINGHFESTYQKNS